MSFKTRVAEYLLQSKAIKLEPAKPFTWASGWKSPIYCDNRITLSLPNVRVFIKNAIAEIIENKYPSVDVIAGVATGAIAQAALVADQMDLPMIYVRPEPKSHGLAQQIEGQIDEGKKVVVVEDLVSTGKSSLNAVKALKAAGAEVLGMVAIFTYGFPTSEEKFVEEQCDLTTLTNYEALLEVALKTKYISHEQLALLKEWRKSPDKWGI